MDADSDEKWHTKEIHKEIVEALPAAETRIPPLGGPLALGIWLGKRFPQPHDVVVRDHDVKGTFFTGLRRKVAPPSGAIRGESSAEGQAAGEPAAEGHAEEGDAAGEAAA